MHKNHGGHGKEEVFDGEINVRSVVMTGVWLIAGIVVSMIAMWFLQGWLTQQQVAADPPTGPLELRGRVMPPGERLQPSPFNGEDTQIPERQLEAFLASQQARVHGWGWVSKEAGIAHIPIEKAIERVLANGLPRAAPTAEIVRFPPSAPGGAGQ